MTAATEQHADTAAATEQHADTAAATERYLYGRGPRGPEVMAAATGQHAHGQEREGRKGLAKGALP